MPALSLYCNVFGSQRNKSLWNIRTGKLQLIRKGFSEFFHIGIILSRRRTFSADLRPTESMLTTLMSSTSVASSEFFRTAIIWPSKLLKGIKQAPYQSKAYSPRDALQSATIRVIWTNFGRRLKKETTIMTECVKFTHNKNPRWWRTRYWILKNFNSSRAVTGRWLSASCSRDC